MWDKARALIGCCAQLCRILHPTSCSLLLPAARVAACMCVRVCVGQVTEELMSQAAALEPRQEQEGWWVGAARGEGYGARDGAGSHGRAAQEHLHRYVRIVSCAEVVQGMGKKAEGWGPEAGVQGGRSVGGQACGQGRSPGAHAELCAPNQLGVGSTTSAVPASLTPKRLATLNTSLSDLLRCVCVFARACTCACL